MINLLPFILSQFVIVIGAAYADQPVQTGISGGSAQEMLKMKTIPTDVQRRKSSGLTVSATCTDHTGKPYSPEEEGYADCMRNNSVSPQLSPNSPNPNVPPVVNFGPGR